jgi:hypothetical protein
VSDLRQDGRKRAEMVERKDMVVFGWMGKQRIVSWVGCGGGDGWGDKEEDW